MFPTRRIITSGGDVFRDEYSLAFGGTNEYMKSGDNQDLGTGDFSITLWTKASDFHLAYFLSKKQDANNRWFMRCDDNDTPRLQFYSKMGGSGTLGYLGGTSINLDNLQNTWVHFAISADRDGNIVGYINGVLDDSDSADDTDLDNTGNLFISRFDGTYSTQNISEIAMYDKALSSSEVKTIYNGREPYNHKEGIATGNLTAWWRMGDGSIDSFNDNGLISDVTDASIGSELLTNGDFSDTTSTDSSSGALTGWTNAGTHDSSNKFTIAGGACTMISDGTDTRLQQAVLTSGNIYRYSIDITAISSGSLYLETGGGTAITSNLTSTGTKIGYFLADNNTLRVRRTSSVSSNTTFDNVSIKEISGSAGIMLNMEASDIEGDTP